MINQTDIDSLEKLHEMRGKGIVTDEEFEDAKRQILEGKPRRTTKAVSQEASVESPAEDDWIGWMTLPLRRYAKFEGRSCRKEFWLFVLATNVCAGILGFLWSADTGYFGDTGTLGTLAFVALVIGLLAVCVPYLALQARRMHDQGRSGWFVLLNLIPYLGALAVLIFMLIPGVEGDNEYGPDPLA